MRYGFFDSEITGYDTEGMPIFDRAESSDFLAMFISRIISDGVLAQPGDCFQVIAHEGMKVKVRPGFGIVRGRFAMDTQDFEVTVPKAPVSYKRIDRIILRANYLQRCCEVVLKEGDPGANPVPPELLQPAAGDYYELCLATVAVNSNQTVITQANITDRRYSEECGAVTQVIDHLDTSVFSLQLNQYFDEFVERSEGMFLEWFDAMKDQLSEDAAGYLLGLVEELKNVKLDKTGDISDTTIAFSGVDELNPEAPVDIPAIAKKSKMRDFAESCLMAVKNVRYLVKMLGVTDISKIGDGTVTGAICELNTGFVGYFDANNVIKAYSGVTPGTTETYIATQNCWVRVLLYGFNKNGGNVCIDGVEVFMHTGYDSATQSSVRMMIPLKKGQTLSVYSPMSYAAYYGIYGMC